MKKNTILQSLVDIKRKRGNCDRNIFEDICIDRNERAYPFSEEVKHGILEKIAQCSLSHYPDVEKYYSKLENWVGLDRNCLFITEGVSGAIKMVYEAFGSPGKNVVIPYPTFALYSIYPNLYNISSRKILYKRDHTINEEEFFEKVDSNTFAVFVANPDMPVEHFFDLSYVRKLAEHLHEKGVLLIIDEVYFSFGAPTAKNLIGEFENLIVLRSFSKAFGLAGIRFGFMMGQQHIIDRISKYRSGYEVSTTNGEIASFFMDHPEIVDDYVSTVKTSLTWLKQKLLAKGFRVYGGNVSNYLFVELGETFLVDSIQTQLKKRNIHIRSGWLPPFDTGITVGGSTQEHMKEFHKNFMSLQLGV